MTAEGVSTAELARSLARIEQKLDGVTSDHEQRLRRVERWMWTALGLSGAGAATGISAWMGG